jgi:cyclase
MMKMHFVVPFQPRAAAAYFLFVALWAALPLRAQINLTGDWTPLYTEDLEERIPGPEIGDWLGLPLNDAGRLFAESWSPSRLTLPEHQCQVHVSPYLFRGYMQLRMWEERDPESKEIVAYGNYINTYEQTRTIWMDGRPHPPDNAPHTWMGFSTGKWEGDVLTVYTTHIKAGWIRRNGAPESDRASMVEHFIRHGDLLTHVSIVTDPVYLTEPLIKSQNFVLNPHAFNDWLYPCEVVEEVVGRKKDDVPNFLPGQNPFLAEFAKKHGLPPAAALGGPETTYPEYERAMRDAKGPAPAPPRPEFAVAANPNDGELQAMPLQGSLFLLSNAGDNTVLQVGKQGVLIVDTQRVALSQKLLAAIAKLSSGATIRYLVNTSADADHTGGNEALRKAGKTFTSFNPAATINVDAADGGTIIAHESVLDHMSAAVGSQSTPSGGWPTDTYTEGPKELFFNGEAVRIFHAPAAHSDGDSIVHFRKSDVVSAGEVFNTTSYPVIDPHLGGSLQGEIDALNMILDLTVPQHDEEGGTLVVPGHGRICDEADVVEYRDMVVIVRDRIRDMIQKGMTAEQVKAARPTLDYDPLYGAKSGAWTTDMFVEAAYTSLKDSTLSKRQP